MLTSKAIIQAAAEETDGYLHVEFEDGIRDVEIEGQTGNMTLFTRFGRNQSSLWNVMVRQANEHFEFRKQLQPQALGEDTLERIYRHFADRHFGVILSNDYVEGSIHVQISMPISERALDKFMEWTPSPAGCLKFYYEALQLSLGEQSQAEHYMPGKLLGNPSN